jgi:hypothetical protein
VERVGCQGRPDDLGDRRRAPLEGVGQRLDDDDPATYPEDEPVARRIERP